MDTTETPAAPTGKKTSHSWWQTLPPEERRERARKAGQASGRSVNVRRWTLEEARAAGRKGGTKIASREGHMAAIGIKGAHSTAERRAEQRARAAAEALAEHTARCDSCQAGFICPIGKLLGATDPEPLSDTELSSLAATPT